MNKIAASLLNVKDKDKSLITNKLLEVGVDWIHYDIMDDIFVPHKGITPEQVKFNIDNTNKHFVDIHLMVSSATNYIEKFKHIADLCTFHYESDSLEAIKEVLEYYKGTKIKIGLAINPKTNIEQIYDFLPLLDLVLIMSVQPGLGGQSWQEQTIPKIKKLKKYISERNIDLLIEVDGGINNKNGPLCFEAGADILVSGSFLCSEPTRERLKSIKNN